MARSNCPRPEELLASQDEALAPHRQAVVAAHVRECLACRRYLREGDEIGRLLRQHIVPRDAPEDRARLKARLVAVPPPSKRLSAVGLHGLFVASLTLVVVLGLGLLSTDTIEGGSSFTRWFSHDSSNGQRRPAAYVDQTQLIAPSTVAEQGRIPFGLLPSSQPAEQRGKRYFRNPSGMAIEVLIDEAGASQILVDRSFGTTEIVAVNGREVYLVTTQTPEGSAVIGFDWIEAGRLVSALVLEQPTGGLDIEGAQEIVAALMEMDAE